ncbi:low temperature requirement protein A [Tabrizicola sp.]|uniref:low temperature requirement protein A n=1 Tax=Tabrizicola sp. TaxID=2005166 RepID=UPI002FDE3E28
MSAILRPLVSRNPSEHHRVSTTLELFFDLITVIAIAAVTAGLHHGISEGHGLEVLPRFLFLFFAIWWCWMNFTWFASAFDNDDSLYRLLVMVIMCGELIFAGGAGYIFDTLDMRFGILGWVIMRLGMAALWLRAARDNPDYRQTCFRYALGILVAQALWALMYFTTAPGSTAFFVAGIGIYVVELAVPAFAESAKPTPFHRHHIIERYGLLMIISLGEIMLSVSHGFGALFSDHPSLEAALTAVSGLVVVFSIWWVYFCEEEQLTTTAQPQAMIWGYGHVLIFLATAVLGAAIAAGVDLATHHGEATAGDVSRWLGLALALLFATLRLVRDRAHRLPAHLAPALPVMAAVFAAGGLLGLPVWAYAILSVVLVGWRSPGRERHGAAS